MSLRPLVGVCLAAGLLIPFLSSPSAPVAAQAPAKIDFQRDVQPIFRQNCYGCHGPDQQMNGFRLDRRSDAFRGGTIPAIGPGNSEGSRLYLRVAGGQFGPQMPPTGALRPEQIATIKAWIDQGAEWPDAASGEEPPPPVDAGASRMNEALRRGDRAAFTAALQASPASARLRGARGVTPLMTAALYGDAAAVRSLIDAGADVNARNAAGATALMWAVADVAKTQALIERGADVNARSADGRTALLVAAGRPGSSGVVTLLLDKGADASISAPGLFGPMTPLAEAAGTGDEALFKLLLERGADVKAAGPLPLYLAQKSGCKGCLDLLLKGAPPMLLSIAAVMAAPLGGDAIGTRQFLELGGDVNGRDPAGRPLLGVVAASDAIPVDTVKLLLARGADIHAKGPEGLTPIELAAQRGDTPVVELLKKAGAQLPARAAAPRTPKPADSARAAVMRGLPLLQRTDATFLRKSGCVSCHNNSLTAETVAAARKRGFPIDSGGAQQSVSKIAAYIETWRERVLQNVGIPGDADTISYILLGLAAENHPPDAATDALAYFLKSKQSPDGRWIILAHRPPIESNDIQVTAASMRALQVYAPAPLRADYDQSVQRAAAWLHAAKPQWTEEHAFKLLGLTWARADQPTLQAAARALLATQRSDGGWSQIPSLASDAYATGEALVALLESGAVASTDPAVQRGVQFLLKTQLEDGSWFVSTRAIPLQPQFDADFPHGRDSWISAAASNWATRALALSLSKTN